MRKRSKDSELTSAKVLQSKISSDKLSFMMEKVCSFICISTASITEANDDSSQIADLTSIAVLQIK